MSGNAGLNKKRIVKISHALDPGIKTAEVILACAGKRPFDDRTAAERGTLNLRSYKCNLCGKYHHTGKSNKRSGQREA
jgi:hypothetical protein